MRKILIIDGRETPYRKVDLSSLPPLWDTRFRYGDIFSGLSAIATRYFGPLGWRPRLRYLEDKLLSIHEELKRISSYVEDEKRWQRKCDEARFGVALPHFTGLSLEEKNALIDAERKQDITERLSPIHSWSDTRIDELPPEEAEKYRRLQLERELSLVKSEIEVIEDLAYRHQAWRRDGAEALLSFVLRFLVTTALAWVLLNEMSNLVWLGIFVFSWLSTQLRIAHLDCAHITAVVVTAESDRQLDGKSLLLRDYMRRKYTPWQFRNGDEKVLDYMKLFMRW